MDLNVVGQVGIVIELIGAAIIVYGSWKTRRQMAGLDGTMDGATDAIENLLGAVRDQFSREMTGFALLAVGLAMQFAGGLSQ